MKAGLRARTDVHCVGEETCGPAATSVLEPAISLPPHLGKPQLLRWEASEYLEQAYQRVDKIGCGVRRHKMLTCKAPT